MNVEELTQEINFEIENDTRQAETLTQTGYHFVAKYFQGRVDYAKEILELLKREQDRG